MDIPRPFGSDCEHLPVWVGQIAVAACADCGTIEWFSASGPVDPAEAIAALFGSYDLIGPVDAIAAPSPRVLAYRPPSLRRRSSLMALPKETWLKAGPHLWMAHDGETLLLSPTRPIEFSNLTRGA